MPRDYKKEYSSYHGKPKQVKRRAARNTSRAKVVKSRGKAAVAGKDVHHKDRNPRNTSGKNLQVTSKKYNRSRNK
jgi:hypothetical protein